jgi:uncharacterized damage-inducible protein DinB
MTDQKLRQIKEKLMMTRIPSPLIACGFTLATVLPTTPAAAQERGGTTAPATQATAAQPTSTQTALASDVQNLSDKFVGLARVMEGKYDWRPGQGVRSVGDVFNLIVMENKMLTGLLTGTGAPAGGGMGGRGNQVTDPAQMQEALRTSYESLKQAVSSLSDADLKTPVKFFGRDTTKQHAALMLLMDQHEHLGQSIAYARTNGVVPPWSK